MLVQDSPGTELFSAFRCVAAADTNLALYRQLAHAFSKACLLAPQLDGVWRCVDGVWRYLVACGAM